MKAMLQSIIFFTKGQKAERKVPQMGNKIIKINNTVATVKCGTKTVHVWSPCYLHSGGQNNPTRHTTTFYNPTTIAYSDTVIPLLTLRAAAG